MVTLSPGQPKLSGTGSVANLMVLLLKGLLFFLKVFYSNTFLRPSTWKLSPLANSIFLIIKYK